MTNRSYPSHPIPAMCYILYILTCQLAPGRIQLGPEEEDEAGELVRGICRFREAQLH